MRTYPIKDGHGRLVAFEIPHVYFSIRSIARLLATVHGATVVYRRPLFGQPSDVHLEFQYGGSSYIVWEPFGDNSRYWIGPKKGINGTADVTPLHDAFERHRPSVLRGLIGGALYLFSMEWVPRPKR
jgi:hypothetical protein